MVKFDGKLPATGLMSFTSVTLVPSYTYSSVSLPTIAEKYSTSCMTVKLLGKLLSDPGLMSATCVSTLEVDSFHSSEPPDIPIACMYISLLNTVMKNGVVMVPAPTVYQLLFVSR